MDLVGPLPTTKNGNRYIIVLTDYLTKWPEAEAIPSKHAREVAKFITKVVCRYGSVKVIITDQGREFCNELNDEICKRLGIDHRRTTAYHPQSNGQCERYNGTLCSSLVKYLNSEQDNWDDFIDPCLLAYRSSVSRSTKQTPFFLAFGKQPTLLVEEDFPVGSEAKEVDEQTALDARIEAALSLFQLHKTAQDNIQSAQKVHKHYYDQKHAPPAYCVGDLVLLNNARRQQRKGDKLAPRWTGPHEISEIRDKGVVRLKDKKALTNVTRIKPYRQPQSSSAPISTSNPTLPCHNPDLPTASSSSSTSADPDCEIVDEVAGSETIVFSPVGAGWQKASLHGKPQ